MRAAIPAAAILLSLVAAGCGSAGNGTATTTSTAEVSAAEFPAAKGRTINDIAPKARNLVLAPSTSVVEAGSNRYGFAIFDTSRRQVTGVPVALYVARKDGTGLRGPFVARSESLVVRPQFRSLTSSQDPDAAKSVYVADIKVPANGSYVAAAVVRVKGKEVLTSPFEFKAGQPGGPPLPGDRAPKVHTPTLASVAGDGERISTRQPVPNALLKEDLFDAYGRKPVALLFATPALCQSRVCGPVVDVLAQAQAEDTSGNAAYITNEIYKDNRVDRGLRPQPAAYRLPTEPWLFVLDAQGRVVERIEGAFSVAEVKRAVARAGG